MRRLPLLLTLGFVFALFVVAAATAAPPADWCDPLSEDYRPTHPSCSDTPEPEPEPPTLQACPSQPFPIEVLKPGPISYECLWTPENRGTSPPSGTVKVDSLDGISSLVVFVLDDFPGDICLLVQGAENQTEPDGFFLGSFDLTYGSMADIVEGAGWDPQDYPEDERPPPFEPYVGQTYWTFAGTHWCYPQDGVAGMREDLNGPALHLSVRFRANPKVTSPVWVTLTPAQQEAGF